MSDKQILGIDVVEMEDFPPNRILLVAGEWDPRFETFEQWVRRCAGIVEIGE